jgi:medium-chain acyl-[acyl-carrier-protein] hydrolase
MHPILKSNHWFICPRPDAGAGMRLFLFPYAGGGPAAFGKWPGELPQAIEAHIAHYPGRGSRYNEQPVKQLASLAERLADSIQPLLDKPFAFLGHSMGGLLAFEVARQLRERRMPQPQTLFVSACGAPHLPDPHPPVHALPDAQFLDALRALNGIPAEIASLPELMELLLPSFRADFAAVEGYRYDFQGPAFDFPVIVLGGSQDPHVSRERLEAWQQHAKAGFRSFYFPGDHFFIHTAREAVVATVAAELRLHPKGVPQA